MDVSSLPPSDPLPTFLHPTWKADFYGLRQQALLISGFHWGLANGEPAKG